MLKKIPNQDSSKIHSMSKKTGIDSTLALSDDGSRKRADDNSMFEPVSSFQSTKVAPN